MPTTANKAQRNKATFQNNRRELLADNPMCHWCGVRPATTADHLIETDRGGTNDKTNLVPSCKSCNSRRGQEYQTRKQRARNGTQYALALMPTNNEINNADPREIEPAFFSTDVAPPPQASFRISESGIDLTKWEQHDRPRMETPLPPDALSYADEIVAWAARHMKVELWEWHRIALHGITAYYLDEKGEVRFYHRTALTSTARQNGKTESVMAPLVGWWLTDYAKQLGKPQKVMNLAHLLETAQEFFELLTPILKRDFGGDAVRLIESYGRSKCVMPDGSTLYTRAATKSAGHSKNLDLIAVDEIWAIAPGIIDTGLIPTQRTKRNPMCAMFSTAGDETSTAMIRWRSQGMASIDNKKMGSLYFAEWSPPDGVDVMTPAAWAWGNPALGHTITMDVIAAEAESPDRNAFLRSSVNIWQASSLSWLRPGAWAALGTAEIRPPGGVLAVEMSLIDSHYYGVRSIRVGKTTMIIQAFVVDTAAEMWDEVAREMSQSPGLKLALVPGLAMIAPPHYEKKITVVGYREILAWTGLVQKMIKEKLVAHSGELLLGEHMNRAVLITHEGHLGISATRSPGPIELAKCVIWATALAAKPAYSQKPVMVVAG